VYTISPPYNNICNDDWGGENFKNEKLKTTTKGLVGEREREKKPKVFSNVCNCIPNFSWLLLLCPNFSKVGKSEKRLTHKRDRPGQKGDS
jgi:hypothetical protein